MSRLFGIPIGTLAALLVVLLAAGVAVIALLALRNRAFFRLGVRSVRRRPGRSALIVTGLMLGTAIIAAALATGDTMGRTIRSSAVSALGRTDELVAARGIGAVISAGGAATGTRYFPVGYADRIANAAAGSGLVAGVEPVIFETVAVQDLASRQSEPRVTLFASDPSRMAAFGTIRAGGNAVSLADLRPGEVYLNAKGAEKLDARAGDTIRVLAGRSVASVRVRAIVNYAGAATADAAVLLPLEPAQQLLGKPGLIRAVAVANEGGVAKTDAVVRHLGPTVSALGLEIDETKKDALDAADAMGTSFMSFFTTFGSFSIAAGVLLIYLIFVMLAAERRSELGIARAVGTRRGHLVQLFLFEGIVYSLLAAAVGAFVGIAVAYGMVLVMAGAFGATSDIQMTYSVTPQSVVVAYAIGVLLTFLVVGISAWRVSRMNIVAAIRNLPEPEGAKRARRRWLGGLAALLFGLLVAYAGASTKTAVPFAFGVSVAILGLVPLASNLGVPDRAARTGAGLALVAWNVLPTSRWLLGNPKSDFSIFIVAGLMIVVGASWTLMYNADVLLGALASTVGRARALAPVLRLSIAYPLRSRFRTGVTLAMFTLVVFTLVVGSITTTSFVSAFDDLRAYSGGFDVRSSVSPAAPVGDIRSALRRAPGLDPADFRVVSAQSTLPLKANQVGSKPEDAVVHGLDTAFLTHTTYGLAARARGYETAAAVWRALATKPGLAVVDATAVPRRSTFAGAPAPPFKLHGFYLEDETFAPVHVVVRDPQTARRLRLTVVGVLAETAPQDLTGIFASQRTLARTFGDRVQPTGYLFALRPGVDARQTAARLESAFLANGMQADALSKLLADAVGANLTFDRLIMGFMGLGLIVGVAALGVISARAVVERRQQIGVLRAVGFRRRMVQASFLLESSFIALTSIVVGTALGLAVAYSVVVDSRRAPSWASLPFDVPWLTLIVIFLTVYAVAMATTLAPARRAARVYPAEALRYQ
ncbi:MAG TPA: FtsX-like permease family protein [Gaiellaceae bacterium]|nr:FtsX-like permease family protein [Gaiellaceae bacterium]